MSKTQKDIWFTFFFPFFLPFLSISFSLFLSSLLSPSITEIGAIRLPSNRRLVDFWKPLNSSRLGYRSGISTWEWWRRIGARGDAAFARGSGLHQGANIMIEGVPRISHAKVIRCKRLEKADKTYSLDCNVSYDGQLILHILFRWQTSYTFV